MIAACTGSVGGGTTSSNVAVKINPTSASVLLGESVTFDATVSGSSNTAVTWTVNGVAGGNAQVGSISASGQYTAPQILPVPPSVTVTAFSHADSNATASATVAITSDVVVNISPASATVVPGNSQVFSATVTSAGDPVQSVTWSVNGVAGGNSIVGIISSTGMDSATYTAPAAAPDPPSVTVTATSVADVSKSASASVTITATCGGTNTISPPAASVALGQSQNFTTTICAPSGTAIAWDVNGVAGGNASLGTIAVSGTNSATYTAPADLPATNPVTIHAVAGTATASASITIVSNVAVSIVPPNASVAVSGRATFSAVVTNTPDATVVWGVNGIANGNASIGQVCLSGSNPCQAPTGPTSANIDYLAPSTVPSSNPVALTATSHADPSRSGSALITVTPSGGGPISIMISPPYGFAPPSGASPSQFQFTAQVTGSNETTVMWSLQSGVTGSGCGGTACGTIDAAGLYTAPSVAPSPNSISVTATSVADPAVSATASVAITSGPTIEQILPSSVMAGAASSFTLAVNGVGFAASTGSTASVILVNGNPRPTICQTVLQCTTPLQPGDVDAAGTSTIQIQNPGEPAPLSNPVPFVVVPFTLTKNVIALSSSQPEVDGNNIVVFEPTTAGVTSAQINVDFAGPITSDGACNFDSSPIEVTRPASGTAVVSICVHGNALDPSFFYQFTGPSTPDISISTTSLASLFPNLIQLNLTISSTTLPGVRSLFISTPNNDQAVATGLLEVQ
ncbi:MAG: hypothetical protein WB787_01810 [Candidatus Acidiferrales bacterium]